MIEIKNQTKERAILVSVRTKDISKETAEEHINELEELAITAGADAIMKVMQDRHAVDVAYYIGKGKAEEIKQLIEMNDIQIIICDDDLTAVQARNLEKIFERKVIDRSGLILDIFASRAKTKEAKTQVELAQLQYMLPRLTRAWTHLSKQFGGIGTKGPGETQIETDRRMIRTRIAMLKDKLSKIEQQREIQVQKRKETIRVGIAGYTNAGKSTLFNLLTNAGNLAEDKLFATLDSTTRAYQTSSGKDILLSDTVGFIRKLPHHLVASFKSTLNEIRDADIILHVIDSSHQFYEDHLRVVEETLTELDCHKKPIIKVFNKIDLIDDRDKLSFLMNKYPNAVLISAVRGINIPKLNDRIISEIESEFVEEKIKLNITETRTLSFIHKLAEVISVKYSAKFATVHIKTNKENLQKIRKLINEK
ncbi:MAG: GTPase HflX [Ignavibacteriaceae bacterium]|nr:GTPase HflX [Ignavibacteriaceae bacterium]